MTPVIGGVMGTSCVLVLWRQATMCRYLLQMETLAFLAYGRVRMGTSAGCYVANMLTYIYYT